MNDIKEHQRIGRKGILNDNEVMDAYNAVVATDIPIRTMAKKLDVTVAALYYRFDRLDLEPPVKVRTFRRNIEIRKLHQEGLTVKELGKKFNLRTPTIYVILRENGHANGDGSRKLNAGE